MTRLRSSTLALLATADKSRFGPSTGSGPSRAASRDGEARSAGWRARDAIRTAFTTAGAVIAGGASSVLACPMCFGAEETAMVDGTKLGIAVMLAITLAVQGGFVGFFLYLRKRAKRIADVELDTEWSELQRASRPS